MILGIYSDLHSNYPALQSMEGIAGEVDEWVALGDSVGLFPDVNGVLDWQRRNQTHYVLGDHEEALIYGRDLEGSQSATESIKNQSRVLSIENREMLQNLKLAEDISSGGLKIRLTHFLSPESRQQDTKYSLDVSALEQIYEGYDFVLFGHTHLRTVIYGKKTIFINPGSAGFPVDVGHQCSMVTLDTVSRLFHFTLFNYDSGALVKSLEKHNYNPRFTQYINNGHSWPQ